MLNTQSLEWMITSERLKDEAAAVEQQCADILGCFDHLDRAPTDAEREARRQAYLDNRLRLNAINEEIDAIARRLNSAH